MRIIADFMFYTNPSEPAAQVRAYAEKLKQQPIVPSVVSDKDDFDKPVIIDELLMAADDIETGIIRIGNPSIMKQAWVYTSNEILYSNRDKGENQMYCRGITVAQHIHHALFHGGDPEMFTPLQL